MDVEKKPRAERRRLAREQKKSPKYLGPTTIYTETFRVGEDGEVEKGYKSRSNFVINK